MSLYKRRRHGRHHNKLTWGVPAGLCFLSLGAHAACAQTAPLPGANPLPSASPGPVAQAQATGSAAAGSNMMGAQLPKSATTAPPPLPSASTVVSPADRPLGASPTPSMTQPLTLDEAVAMALGSNPAIAQTNAALLTAEGQIGEERSSLGAKFGADVGVNGYSQGINAYNGSDESQRDSHFQPSVGANATLPIDLTGYLHAATDEAHFRAISARLDVNRARNQVVGGVENAFFNVLRSQSLVNVARENLRDSITRRDDAQAKFNAQTVAILDVVRAQTDVANAQQQLISAQSQVAVNLARLSNAIGLNVSTQIQVTEAGAVQQPEGVPPPAVPAITSAADHGNTGLPGSPLPPPNDEAALKSDMAAAADVAAKITANLNSPANTEVQNEATAAGQTALGPDFNVLVEEAIKTRPEILQGDADVEAAKKGIRYAQRSMLPQMSVGLRYEYAAQTFGTSVELNNAQAFVGFTLPIIDAGLARSRVQEAKGREANAIVTRRQVEDAVSLDVREAYLNLLDSRARVGVANQALAQAREAFLLARVRYNAGVTAKAGVSPLLEVSDAQAAVVAAETNQVNAVYDFNTARVRLNFAIGRYSYTPTGPGYAAPPNP